MPRKSVKKRAVEDEEVPPSISSSLASSFPTFPAFINEERELHVIRLQGREYEFPMERLCQVHELLTSAETSFRNTEQEIQRKCKPFPVFRVSFDQILAQWSDYLVSSNSNVGTNAQAFPPQPVLDKSVVTPGHLDAPDGPYKYQSRAKVPHSFQALVSNLESMQKGYQGIFEIIQQAPLKLLLKVGRLLCHGMMLTSLALDSGVGAE
jgi:hypothetical protein